MSNSLVLSSNSRVRYATGSFMYFAQGIPMGLLGIAIPAWLASEGASASDIASYRRHRVALGIQAGDGSLDGPL